MGNWRTVNITGTMTAADAATLLDRLDHGPDYDRDVPEGAWCLSFSRARPSLCGIGAWPAERVSACGNLAERD